MSGNCLTKTPLRSKVRVRYSKSRSRVITECVLPSKNGTETVWERKNFRRWRNAAAEIMLNIEIGMSVSPDSDHDLVAALIRIHLAAEESKEWSR